MWVMQYGIKIRKIHVLIWRCHTKLPNGRTNNVREVYHCYKINVKMILKLNKTTTFSLHYAGFTYFVLPCYFLKWQILTREPIHLQNVWRRIAIIYITCHSSYRETTDYRKIDENKRKFGRTLKTAFSTRGFVANITFDFRPTNAVI